MLRTKSKPLPPFTETDADRFWDKIAIKDEDSCWLWTRSTVTTGYGQFRTPTRNLLATRVAFMLYYGADPHPLYILHKCDNPLCCNPHHFSLGMDKENMRDAMAKGRWNPRGESNGMAKLKDSDILDIRKTYIKYSSERGIPALARKYGVDNALIHRIVTNQVWKHV